MIDAASRKRAVLASWALAVATIAIFATVVRTDADKSLRGLTQLVRTPVFGVAPGQVAHLAVINLSDNAVEWVFRVLGVDGNVVAEITDPVKLGPGGVLSRDLELGETVPRDRFGRAHLRVEFTGLAPRGANPGDLDKARYSIEVFDGDTGKASVFFGNDVMLAEDH